MCEWGTNREVTIERRVQVDACIADQIVELNRLGVYTTGCCCGHGKGPPTATIMFSSQERARALGYTVVLAPSGDPEIALRVAATEDIWTVVERAASFVPAWVDTPPQQARSIAPQATPEGGR